MFDLIRRHGARARMTSEVVPIALAGGVIDRDRRVPLVQRLGFASDVEPGVGSRVPHLEHLILQNNLLAVQEPDVTRILPSGWRSMTIVVRSDVAKRSRTCNAVVNLMDIGAGRLPLVARC